MTGESARRPHKSSRFLATAASARQRLRVQLDRLELAAREARLLRERHRRVDAELGAHAAIRDADVFVAARRRHHEDVLRRLHAGRQRILDVGRIADVDIVIDHDHHVEVLQRAERRHDGVALQAVVGRAGLPHLDDGVEAVQPARRHLGVGDDRHRGLQHLEQARLQHVFAQHHGLAAVAVDGVIDRFGAMRDRGDFQHRRGIGRRQIADEFAERPFFDFLVAPQHALEHDLALGRHQQILRQRLHHRQRAGRTARPRPRARRRSRASVSPWWRRCSAARGPSRCRPPPADAGPSSARARTPPAGGGRNRAGCRRGWDRPASGGDTRRCRRRSRDRAR